MFRRLFVRALSKIAVRVISCPCAFWFGARVLVIVPGVGMFHLDHEQARYLAVKLLEATNKATNPQR